MAKKFMVEAIGYGGGIITYCVTEKSFKQQEENVITYGFKPWTKVSNVVETSKDRQVSTFNKFLCKIVKDDLGKTYEMFSDLSCVEVVNA